MHAAKGILTARGGMTSHAAVVARGMGRPCVSGAGSLKIDIAKGEGDLTKRVPCEGNDEIAHMGGYFNEFIEKLQQMIKKVAHVTDKVASASVELSATAEEISKGTDTLTSRASQTAAAVEEMNATVGQVAQNSGKAASLAQDTVKTAQDGGTVVSSALVLMRDIIRERYANGQWNIYGAQASDGDNWDNDSPICRKLLDNDILPWCQYFAYIEITSGDPQNLWREYEKLSGARDNFAMQHIESPADIYPVFRELFKKTIA